MIPEVIVIILLATAVVTSMKLEPVDQCPNDEEWSVRAHKVCDNNEYRYHCMFTVDCILVECCIEPQLGSYLYSETEYAIYFLNRNNETGSPEFYQLQFDHLLSLNLITNSSTYWEYLYVAYCKKYTKYKFVLSRTENQTKIPCEENQTKCEDSSCVIPALAITCSVLLLALVVCIIVLYKHRKKIIPKDSNDSDTATNLSSLQESALL